MRFKLTGQDLSDIIIGMSDGLTVPFALAAGLAGAVAQSHVVLIGGLAELTAGGISMGLGGYLAAKSEKDAYYHELLQEQQEIKSDPEEECQEVRELLTHYGLEGQVLADATAAIIQDPQTWVQFMMREELKLEPPKEGQPLRTAAFIGGSYVVGGFVPLVPYMFFAEVLQGFYVSVLLTCAALLLFGWSKGKASGVPPLKAALETFMVGSLATSAAYVMARLVSHF